jgi:hypothetical protein
LRVRWNHEADDQPVFLLSELMDDLWEVRKIEIFRDGSMGCADADHETESTFLSEKPLPSFEEIALDPQFVPEWIEKSEFERLWKLAHQVPHFS